MSTQNIVTVYGASDDLIEFEGAIRDEVGAYGDDDEQHIAFSDGTVLAIQYGRNNEGFWRIRRVVTGSAKYELREATSEDDDYSDRATLTGDLTWALVKNTLIRATHNTKRTGSAV